MLKCCLSFPKCKNAVMCLREKNTCVRKASFMASSAVGHKFSINELPVYSKMSLNRNSHKTKLCIDRVDQNDNIWRCLRLKCIIITLFVFFYFFTVATIKF